MEHAASSRSTPTTSTIAHPDPFSTGHPLKSLSRSVPPTANLNIVLPQSQATSSTYPSNFQDLSPLQPSVYAQADTWALSREVHEIKHRRRTTRQELRVLEETYSGDQKPNLSLRTTLGEKLGMSPRQVQVWFQNRRAKDKKSQVEESPPQRELVPPPTIHRRGSAPALVHCDQGPPNGAPNDLSSLRRGSLPASVLLSPPRPIRIGDAFGRRRSLHQGYFPYPRPPAPPSLPHPTQLPQLPDTSPPRITTRAIPGPMPAPGYSFGSCSSSLLRGAEDETLVEEELLPYPSRDNWTRPRYGSFAASGADSDSNSADTYSRFGSIPGDTYSRFGSIPGGSNQIIGANTRHIFHKFLQGFSSMHRGRESIPQAVTRTHRDHSLHHHLSYSPSEPQLPSSHIRPHGAMAESSSASPLSYDILPQSSTPSDSPSFTAPVPIWFYPYPTSTSTAQNETSYQPLPHADNDHHQPGVSYSFGVSSQFSPPSSAPPSSSDALSAALPLVPSTPDSHHTGSSSTYSRIYGASSTDLFSG